MKKKLSAYAALAVFCLGLSAESKAFTLLEILLNTPNAASNSSKITYTNPSSNEYTITFTDGSGVTYTGTGDFSNITVRDGMAYYSFPVTITGGVTGR